MEEREMRVRAGAGEFVCGNEVEEKGVCHHERDLAERWAGQEKNGKGERKRWRSKDPGGSGTKAVYGFDGFVGCGRFALGDLAALCLEEDVGLFVDALCH